MSAFTAWRAPADSEIADGVAALAAIIGPVETAKLSWQRRLVASEPGGQWGLVIQCCARPSLPNLVPWVDEIQLREWPEAFPLAEGVAILLGPAAQNPEEVMRERRARVKAHEEEEAAAKRKKQDVERAAKADAEQREADERRFNAAGWHRLDEWQQAFFGLAVRVQSRDPSLAADLRTIANEGRGSKPARPGFPRCDWERGS